MRPCLDPIMMGVEMRSCCNFAFFFALSTGNPKANVNVVEEKQFPAVLGL